MSKLNTDLAKAKKASNTALVTELTENITDITTDIATIRRKIKAVEKDIIDEETDITTVEADIVTIVTDIGVKKTNIAAQDIVLKQVEKNVSDNKVEAQKAKYTNKGIAKKNQETFNYLNRNRASVQQDPNESKADFIASIKSLESLAFDPNIHKQKAANEYYLSDKR